jgi:hypothetical protein
LDLSRVRSLFIFQLVEWAQTNNKRAFLTAFGGGANLNCLIVLNATLSYMDSNSDIYIGFV